MVFYLFLYVIIFCFYVSWYLISGLFKLIWNLIFNKGNGSKITCTNGEEYETMCYQKLRQYGFTHIETTPRSGDHGIDILAHRAGKKYAIQCKYYSSPVGNHAVQEAYSGCSYYDCDIPVVLTNNTFTKSAIDEAKKNGIQLWAENKIPFSDSSIFKGLFKQEKAEYQYQENYDRSDDANYITYCQTSDTNGAEIRYITGDIDIYFVDVGKFIIEKRNASVGILQRTFKIGYNRVEKILDQLAESGVVSKYECNNQRKILLTLEEFNYLIENNLIKSANDRNQKTDDYTVTYNDHFDNMDGHTFEHYCAGILRKNGFYDVEVTKGSSDQGIDIIAFKDGIKYGIQCKCYSSDIGNKAVQEAFSGKTFYGCHVAAVLTNRYFTKSAKELSENNKVLLWDRDKLEEYIRNADNNQKQY